MITLESSCSEKIITQLTIYTISASQLAWPLLNIRVSSIFRSIVTVNSSLFKTSMPLSRGVAFAIHLVSSLLIFSILVIVMLLYWFPGELFFIDGGWQGLKLVAMVDLVLGPALTLLLYKPGKPKLILDMTMIASIQIAALAFGFYTTYHQRTVAIVYSEKAFSTVSAKDHKESLQQLAALDIQPPPITEAGLLSIPLYLTPDPADYGKFLEDIFNGYPGPNVRSDQYVAINSRPDELEKGALTEKELEDLGSLSAVQKALGKHNVSLQETRIYKFEARFAEGVVLFDPQHNRIIDYVTRDDSAQIVAEADVD